MELDMDRVLVFWDEDREEARRVRQAALQDERTLYTYAARLLMDAQRINSLCDDLDALSVRLSETAD